jgi:shikimate kinase
MNIILTGLRGSGKTKIGKLLANKLEWNFLDIDEEIEKAENIKIPQIIAKKGWEYFRKKEEEIVKKIAGTKTDKTVISTGGGTIINQKNELLLKKIGKIIYLHVLPEICATHIKNSKNRPPLTNEKNTLAEIKKLYKERDPIYKKTAAITFKRTNNENKDSEKIIKLLLEA